METKETVSTTAVNDVQGKMINDFSGQIIDTFFVLGLTVLGLVIKDFFKPWVNKQKQTLQYSYAEQERIEESLLKMRISSGADIVYLARFTNGVETIDGSSVKSCLVTNESQDEGLKKISGLINERIAPYTQIILASLMRESFHKRVTSDIKDDSYRGFLRNLGCQYSSTLFLHGGNFPLGFIGFHWRNKDSRRSFDRFNENTIKLEADILVSKLIGSPSLISKVVGKFMR